MTWKKLVGKAKSEFYVKKIEDCEGDQRKLYSVIDGLMGRNKPTVLPSATSNHILAGTLNNFFVTKIVNIKQDLSSLEQTVAPMTIENLDTILGTPAEIMDTYQLVSAEEVTKIIRKSPKATCLLDPAPTLLVVQFLPQLAPYITEIVNMSLKSGSFPAKLKSAIVKPRIKKPTLDPEILTNYRPVSNLSFLSKIIEKVVARQLLDHMKKNGLLEKMQSAYKEAHSTETALLRVQNDILSTMDEKKGVFLILLDLSAAFDTVDHHLLLSFLETHVGLRGSVLNLLRMYLTIAHSVSP